MNCKNCGTELLADEKFCSSCGKSIQQVDNDIFCPQCGTKAEPSSAFCYDCGYSFSNPDIFTFNSNGDKKQFSYTLLPFSEDKQFKSITIAIIALLVILLIEILIWVANDPKVKDELLTIGCTILFIIGFVWYLRRKKKHGED